MLKSAFWYVAFVGAFVVAGMSLFDFMAAAANQ